MTLSDVQQMLADAIDTGDGFAINMCQRALNGDEAAWAHLERDHNIMVLGDRWVPIDQTLTDQVPDSAASAMINQINTWLATLQSASSEPVAKTILN